MKSTGTFRVAIVFAFAGIFLGAAAGFVGGQTNLRKTVPAIPAPASKMQPLPASKVITEADCSADKLGTSIPVASIGEPVSAVTLKQPVWNAAANGNPAYCSVDGSMAPV